MLGLFGMVKENLEQQGVVLPKFFSKKNILLYKGSEYRNSELISSDDLFNFTLFDEKGKFDFSEKSWEFTAKATRTKLGVKPSYFELRCVSKNPLYYFIVACNDASKTIHSWRGPEWNKDRDVTGKSNYSGSGSYWLRLSWNFGDEFIKSSYSLDGSTFHVIHSEPISNFDSKKLNFYLCHCADYTQVLKKDITFKYGDEILFGS